MHLFPSLIGKMFEHLVRTPPAFCPRYPMLPWEEEFVKRIKTIAEQHINDPHFTTTVAATSLAMSRMHLNRKLRASTGQSTHQFIQAVRLEASRSLLLAQPLPVNVIAGQVGFKSTSHFTRVFRLKFGLSPSQYRRQCQIDPPSEPPVTAS
jgi:transcriptional regulator GlxA family with amidase domain